MQSFPTVVPGVDGTVVATVNQISGRTALTVDGIPFARGPRRTWHLPATGGGLVPAKIRARFHQPYPALLVRGQAHRLGPTAPTAVSVLIMLPIVGVAFGVLGILLAMVGVQANAAIWRGEGSTGFKVAMMAAVFAGVLLTLVVAVIGISVVLGR